MAAALRFARYDHRFEMGTGGHDLKQGGAIFPDTLRWVWRDYPGVKGAGDPTALGAVMGQWDVVTHMGGGTSRSVLTLAEQGETLTATLTDDKDGELDVIAVSFEDDILSYEYLAPQSPLGWDEGAKRTMVAWLRVTGDSFEGALSAGADFRIPIDYATKGRKKG